MALGLFLVVGCQKKKSSLETTLPRGSYDLVKMASGALLQTSVERTEGKETALATSTVPEAYDLQVTLKMTIPLPATTVPDLCAGTPELSTAFPKLEEMLPEASSEGMRRASPFYETLFNNKLKTLKHQLYFLGQLPPRDSFYDCQTIIPLTNKTTQSHALLVEAIMNVNADGSDGDRNIPLEKLSSCYQPQTNYRWPKATPHVNPNSATLEEELTRWKKKLVEEPTLTLEQKNKLQQQITSAQLTLDELKKWSFLIGSADPFIVLPKFMLDKENGGAAIGDYAVVFYQGILYPAIVGDIGPSSKIGEASLRLCRAIDTRSGADHRPSSAPPVSYFIFPGSAELPFKTPDYTHWSERCHDLWKNLGGNTTLPWHEWEKLEQPWPEGI